MYENLHKQGLGDFEDSLYWSAEYIESLVPFREMQDFSSGEQHTVYGNNLQGLEDPCAF